MKKQFLNAPTAQVKQSLTRYFFLTKKYGFGLGKGFLLLFFFFSMLTLQAENTDFPAGGDGSAENPYKITNRTELDKVRNYLGAANANLHFELTADIDMSASDWTPIGTSASPFRGKFHGNGHKLLNLKTTNAAYNGLFGVVNAGALIEDVHIVGGAIDYTSTATGTIVGVGAIVGYIPLNIAGDVIIRNNSNSAAVSTHTASTGAGTGGIVGNINITSSANGNVILSQNRNTGSVTGSGGERTGGIVGIAATAAANFTIDITSNYNSGDVTGESTVTYYTGGIVGYAFITTAAGNINITSNYNGGNVTGKSEAIAARIGGVVGYANIGIANSNITISNNSSYAKVETTSSSGTTYIGGIAGLLNASITAANTGMELFFDKNFAAGSVVGNLASTAFRSGGLIGYSTFGAATLTIKNSVAAQDTIYRPATNGHRIICTASGYTDRGGSVTYGANYAYKDLVLKNATGTATATDNGNTEGTGKTFAELLTESTYKDGLSWNFTDTWKIEDEVTYPYLQWQDGPYLPTVKYNYTGSEETIVFDNANPPTVVLESGNKPSLVLELTPPEGGSAYLEQNPVPFTSAQDIIPNKVFSVSEKGIRVTCPFTVQRTSEEPFVEYTATLKYQDGVTDDVVLTANYDNNYTITRPENPTRDEYAFDDWYSDETYTDVWDFDAPLTQDVTLYARWIRVLLGEGTQESPYLIKIQEQLDSIRTYSTAHFKLANNIELTFSEDDVTGWEPIAGFSGSLDGDGKQIIGLWSHDTSSSLGLFADLSGVIKDLGIAIASQGIGNATAAYAGGLAGSVTGGSIDGVYVTGGAIGGATTASGGLAGAVDDTEISNSYATVDVNSSDNGAAGGLVGTITGFSKITNSYAAGQVTGNSLTGGLAGAIETAGIEISNSFALGKVVYDGTATTVGSFAGTDAGGIVTGGYNSEVNEGLPADDALTALTNAETKEAATYAAWYLESSDKWGIYDAFGYPYLKAFGNHILIIPETDPTEAVYTGEAITFDLDWDANDNYDAEISEITGELAIDATELIDAGEYRIISGSLDLKNPYYQISFNDSVYAIISKATQSITFTPETTLDIADRAYALSATATSGLPVLFRLRDTDAYLAEITGGNQLTLISAGEIEVTAYVAANNNYEDATEVTVPITITGSTVGIGALPAADALTAKLVNGLLKITGIAAGESVAVYSAQGTTVYRQAAVSGEQNIQLPVRGVYVVVAAEKKVKVVY
jgi:uncharacterized repeat protein (TIGR02543 family)